MSHNRLLTHIVFSTKEREPLLSAGWRPELFAYIGGIVRNHNGVLDTAGGVEDHVHLLVAMSPDRSVSEEVRDIKANSSRWIKEKGFCAGFAWQTKYGAFSVGDPREVRLYIASQEEHHRTTTFQDEYLAFLKKYDIPFDPRFVFE